ncbi:MAG: hypothetical protein KR126chlam3_01390 [Chlamydiae bacterium]|nr:hypothetical protein [Chlamydiota bacterium]
MTTTPVEIKSNANFFQKNLIPEKSNLVRYCMYKAGVFASHSNIFYAHFASVGCAIAAIAISFFNMLSYFLQPPFKILLNIVQFSPIKSVKNLFFDIANGVQSLVFVSMGMTFVVAGSIFPKAIFTYFAPEYYQTLKERNQHEIERNKRKISRLEEENNELSSIMDTTSAQLQNFEREIDDLKHPKPPPKPPAEQPKQPNKWYHWFKWWPTG